MYLPEPAIGEIRAEKVNVYTRAIGEIREEASKQQKPPSKQATETTNSASNEVPNKRHLPLQLHLATY
jgi:hypothetical protein